MTHRVSKITYLIALSLLLSLLAVFSSCREEELPVAVTSVSLNSTSMELVEGTTQTLVATVSPSNAENQKVIWSTSNSSVASVTDGVVTAVKAGTATITVKTDDGNKTATCKVTVVAEEISVTSVSLDQTAVELAEGGEVTLTATVKPDDATNKNVSWTSSNESVATVDNGKITAVKAGTTTITVKTDDGNKTATCKVTVVAKEISVTSVSLDQTAVELAEGGEVILTATVKPDDATNKNVSWSSSNSSVASVTDGVVTAVKAGTATITVKTDDGNKTATCKVTVVAKEISVTSVSLDQTAVELAEGGEVILTATVKPDDATNKNVSWSSSNSSVASVTDGVVTAVKAGTATITVKTDDGNKTATCKVTVVAKEISVTSVSLDQTAVELAEGDEVTLTATVKPDDATNKNVSWTSSNESVATVDNGKITAVKAGSSIITVTTEDGNKSAICEVTVLQDENSDAIVFADAVMKELCITAFDTNGDGELSYAEAAAVTDLSQMKLTKKTFKSFDEFQYFTGVTSIPDRYFREIGIKSIILPRRLKSIGSSAFEDCSNLQSITIPESVTSIGKEAFRDCSSLQSITIPESVTSIGDWTFYGCSCLSSITLPESVTSIGWYAFYHCTSLQSITIPESVASIGSSAFYYCTSLQSITIPESVTSIGNGAFECCYSLQSITIPESVTSIGDSTFQGCTSLQCITIPESVTSIGKKAFCQCYSLQSITIPESVYRIGESAFFSCSSLQSITIPESVTSIDESVFYACSNLQSITLPESVTSIGKEAFRDCSSLQSITIPESMTDISMYAFCHCTSLQSITIPESVTSIGTWAFAICSSLEKVYVKSQDCISLGDSSFYENAPSRKIYVPYKVLDTYKTTDGWSKYANDIVGYDYENNKVVE